MCFVDQQLRKESTLYGRVVLGDPIAFPRIVGLSHLAKMISNGMVDTMLVPEKQPDPEAGEAKVADSVLKLVNCFGKAPSHQVQVFGWADLLSSRIIESGFLYVGRSGSWKFGFPALEQRFHRVQS